MRRASPERARAAERRGWEGRVEGHGSVCGAVNAGQSGEPPGTSAREDAATRGGPTGGEHAGGYSRGRLRSHSRGDEPCEALRRKPEKFTPSGKSESKSYKLETREGGSSVNERAGWLPTRPPRLQ